MNSPDPCSFDLTRNSQLRVVQGWASADVCTGDSRSGPLFVRRAASSRCSRFSSNSWALRSTQARPFVIRRYGKQDRSRAIALVAFGVPCGTAIAGVSLPGSSAQQRRGRYPQDTGHPIPASFLRVLEQFTYSDFPLRTQRHPARPKNPCATVHISWTRLLAGIGFARAAAWPAQTCIR